MCPAVLQTMHQISDLHDDDSSFTVIGAINTTFQGNDFQEIPLEELGVSGLLLTTIGTSTINTKLLDLRLGRSWVQLIKENGAG